MPIVADAAVAVRGDLSKFGQDLRGVDKPLQSLGGRIKSALSPANIAGGLAVGFGAAKVLDFMTDAVSAASNLGETVAATSVIFGDEAMPALEAWAETAAETFGQSERQALDAANTFATFGKSAGLAGDDLVGFSTELTVLASDLASFKNTTPEEAILAIGAALRGESEPIRRYGVLLDDATLKQRALKLGIIKTTKDALTPQQRVLAAQAEILAQTGDAQGDYARTSDGLANTQRELAAQWEDMQAQIGEKLLPIFLDLANFAIDVLIPAIGGLVDIAETAGNTIGDFAEHVDQGLKILGLKESTIKNFGEAWDKSATETARAAFEIEEAIDGLPPKMQAAVDELLATAKEVPEGLSVTLENGTEVVGASTTELAQLLPAAIRQARRDAVIAAYPAPGEIAAAILAGKKELDPVRQMLIDALTKPVSDAKSLAQAQALLFDPLLGRALGKTGFSETQAAGIEGAGLLVDSILAAEPDIFDAGTKMPPAIARGFRNTRNDVIQAVRDLNDDQAMTAGEVAKYLEDAGEDGLAALVRGIRSKKSAVNTAQDEVNAGILLRASKLAGIGYTAGENLARGVGSGITDYTYVPVTATGTMARYIGKQLPLNSPPEDPNSPLANIYGVGGNIIDAVTGGIWRGMGTAERAASALASALRPSFGGVGLAGVGSLGSAPLAAGGDVTNVYLPGRERRLTAAELAGDLRRLEYGGQLHVKPRPPND